MNEETPVFGMKGGLEPFAVRCFHYRIEQNSLQQPFAGY